MGCTDEDEEGKLKWVLSTLDSIESMSVLESLGVGRLELCKSVRGSLNSISFLSNTNRLITKNDYVSLN